MENLDMNVNNYSLSELMAIVELNDLEQEDILENTNYYIQKYNRVHHIYIKFLCIHYHHLY